MEFQFDCGKQRRHVEGWNCIIYETEDKIGLSAIEYEPIAFDFESNSMFHQAEDAYKRAIKRGSVKSRYLLAKLLETQGQTEEAYEWYLEAALGSDINAIRRLSKIYHHGTTIRQDVQRTEELEQYLSEIGENKSDASG